MLGGLAGFVVQTSSPPRQLCLLRSECDCAGGIPKVVLGVPICSELIWIPFRIQEQIEDHQSFRESLILRAVYMYRRISIYMYRILKK